jgi:hypothetical protein
MINLLRAATIKTVDSAECGSEMKNPFVNASVSDTLLMQISPHPSNSRLVLGVVLLVSDTHGRFLLS